MSVQSKNRLRLSALIFLYLITTSWLFSQQSENLLLNGSFEVNSPPGGFKTLHTGDMIQGWEVMQGTVDLTGTYFNSYDGDFSMDMNGTPGTGTIEQRFFTEKGKKYLLTFYLAGNCVGGPKIKRLMVYIGDESQLFEFDTEGKSNNEMGWIKCEMVFKATGRKTTLRFESPPDYEPSNYGAAIDMVSVVPTSRKVGSKSNKANKESKASKTTKTTKTTKNKGNGGFFGLNYGILGGVGYYFAGESALELLSYDANRINLEATKGSFGLHLGAFGELIAGPVFLRPEFRLSTHKMTYGLVGTEQEANQRYQQLEIPVLLGMEVNSLRFFLGPVSHIYIFKIGNLDALGTIDKDIRPLTFSYELGAGINLSFVSIDLRFSGNLSRYGDGILINDSTKLYSTDMPDRLLLTLSFPLN